jgi:hypothetical protein
MTNGNGQDHDRRVLDVHKWSRNNVLDEIRPVPLNE